MSTHLRSRAGAVVTRVLWTIATVAITVLLGTAGPPDTAVREDGYRGIWYSNQPTGDAYGYKYSGGMATYPQQHAPIAIYAPAVDKTFFVYGGTVEGEQRLLHMVSYFDHRTGTVPQPRRLLDKETSDAHDNPTLSIDADGYLYVFSNAHGPVRPTFIHRSRAPYSIEAFDRLPAPYFSYSQPWRLAERFLLLHTRYEEDGRSLYVTTSPDARTWTEPRLFARMREGSYQISWSDGQRVATAFDLHPDDPDESGLNRRTNLYYAETTDGASWQTAAGAALDLPLRSAENPALVRDYRSERRLVYLKDLAWDEDGSPVILFLVARDHRPGPDGGPREWQTARWDRHAGTWVIQPLTTSDHNYDHGSLFVEAGGRWRVLAPTDPGAYPWGTGGDLVLWESRDRGATWSRLTQVTHGGRNHSYARRPLHAHPDFWALWADGNPLAPSASALYFTDRDATRVWRLPVHMTGEAAKPEVVW